MEEKTCCFTGHRKIPADKYQIIAKETEKAIKKLIKEGYVFFCAGGALGFDTIAEKAVIKLRRKYDISLVLVLPCTNQADKWKEEDKEIYESIKEKANIIVYTSQSYTPYCMHKRNRFLVDDSTACICYLTQKSGGTFYTVNYAKKKNLTILNIADKIL